MQNLIQACSITNTSFISQNEELTLQEIENSGSNVCIFCMKYRKKSKGRYDTVHHTTLYQSMDNILIFAIKWDMDTAAKIQSCIDNETKIWYHKICKLNYCNSIKAKAEKNKDGPWQLTRTYYQAAFSAICEYVQEHVVENGNAITE